MSRLTIVRSNKEMPILASVLDAIRNFLFGVIDGFTRDDQRAWRRLWKRIKDMEAGEMLVLEVVFPRSSPFHRWHMCIEQQVFNAQERFQDFEQFRYWVKVGAAWVTWAAGPKGGMVPIPKSISYAKADEEEFRQYHDQVIDFLRGEHAAKYLWPHLKDGAHEMMEGILEGFDE